MKSTAYNRVRFLARKIFFPVLLCALFSAPFTTAQKQSSSGMNLDGMDLSGLNEAVTEKDPLPKGNVLLEQVRAQFPIRPINMEGRIRSRSDEKKFERLISTQLRFGEAIPFVHYEVADRLGDVLEDVKIRWTRIGIEYESDKAVKPSDEIAETGITWSDLSFDFLWWDGARVIGRDHVKTRPCIMVDIPAPKARKDFAVLRLWVDEAARVVVKAEYRDARRKVLRKMEVESIKEIEKNVWMVKDVEVRSYAPVKRKTTLRIDNMGYVEETEKAEAVEVKKEG